MLQQFPLMARSPLVLCLWRVICKQNLFGTITSYEAQFCNNVVHVQQAMMDKEPNMYTNLIASDLPVEGPIKEDIPRTMYDHEMFCSKSRVNGRDMLRRVLTAYGRFDQEVRLLMRLRSMPPVGRSTYTNVIGHCCISPPVAHRYTSWGLIDSCQTDIKWEPTAHRSDI